jgi:ribosomal protein L24
MFSGFVLPSASAQGKDGLKRQFNAQTGKVSFIGPETGRVLSASGALGITTFARPADPGMALVQRFGPEFGLTNPERELTELKTNRLDDGRVTVRYQQNYQGVPIIGGELIVNTNDNGDLYSINGELSPDFSIPTQPKIDSNQAGQTALQAVAKWYQKAPQDFVTSEPQLWIYDESLLQSSTRPIELVWRIEVTAKEVTIPVSELVLVNAERGHISLHFNQIDTAWSGTQETLSVLHTTSTPVYMPLQAGITWYVATTGNDSNSCSSTGSPCKTINGAIGKATAGDIIRVATGNYTGTGTEVVLINKSITISGGWNASFTTQSGQSTINGQSARWGIAINSNITAIVERALMQNGKSIIGGGIYNAGGTVTLRNSIVAGNLATVSGPDCYGSISSAAYNLIGSTSGCTFTSSTGDVTNVNPMMGELIGSPGYHALPAGSPAIDAGNPAVPGSGGNACLAKDERGVTRPVGVRCYIGAYEYSVPGSVTKLFIVSGNGQHARPGSAFTNPLKVAALDSQGSPVPNASVTFTAPGSGASGTFASTGTQTMTAVTDANGIASSSTFTANAISGSYTIAASASGAASVTFSLQNVAWYVATTGSNSNNCQTPTTPCASINGALSKTAFTAGDTVLVATGTYTGSGSQVVLLSKDARLLGVEPAFSTQDGLSTIDGKNARGHSCER